MLIDKFKQSKEVDLLKASEKYVSKHFENIKFSKIQSFISSISTTRNVVSNLNSLEKSFEAMKTYKDQIVSYISMLNIMKSKFNFGSDQYSIKLELGWKDVLTNDFFYSYNIYHEYYSVMFNLGVMYYAIGKFENNGDESKMKEQIKFFQYSAFIFDKIKQEVPTVIPYKEVQPDLSSDYLTYAGYISLAYSQILIYEVSKKKNLALELQAQLAHGISDLFNLAFNLTKETLKKYISDDVRIYLKNRRDYYMCCSYLKMKDSLGEIFKQKAEGYGKMIGYTHLALDCLKEGEKDIIKAKNLMNLQDYIDFKNEIENMLKEMELKNQNIYFDFIPELKLLPKVEKLIKALPLNPPDDFNKFIEGQNSLDDMIPKEVKIMVDNYKQSIMSFIQTSLDKYENEISLTQFLNSLNLPTSLEATMTMNDIPHSLWNRILDVHRRGGAMFLNSTLTTLEQKNDEILKKIFQMEKALLDETQEDDKYRSMYNIKRWSRKPSKELNIGFYQLLYDYKQKLQQSKSCDTLVKESIMSNMKYFEFLNLTKEKLLEKLPVKSDSILSITNSLETQELSSELELFNILRERLKENINKAIQNVNEENVATLMIKVLQKKTTEQAIIAEGKSKYEAYFKQIEEINNQLIESKNRIIEKNGNFMKVKMSSMKLCEPNEKFFADLEAWIQLYNNKCASITQGLNFYAEFSRRINQLSQSISDFLMARDIEKNQLLYVCSGQTHIPSNYLSNPLLNPSTNTVTNIDYKYTYQPLLHSNKFPGSDNHPYNTYSNWR